MKKTYNLYDDTLELRNALESADWILLYEGYEGDILYCAYIDDEKYYKEIYSSGHIHYTDDPEDALGSDD